MEDTLINAGIEIRDGKIKAADVERVADILFAISEAMASVRIEPYSERFKKETIDQKLFAADSVSMMALDGRKVRYGQLHPPTEVATLRNSEGVLVGWSFIALLDYDPQDKQTTGLEVLSDAQQLGVFGIFIDKSFRGKGYAKELSALVASKWQARGAVLLGDEVPQRVRQELRKRKIRTEQLMHIYI